MEGRVRAGLTPAEGRKFGLVVGAAFVVLALVFLWRGHEWPMRITAGIGGLLVLAGLIVPGRLGPVYHAWMGLALAISKVTTPIFMGIVYYLIIAPLGLVLRLFGWNAMKHEPSEGSFWQSREGEGRGGLTRQF